MEATLKKIMIKQFELISNSILDSLLNKIASDDTIIDTTKKTLEEVIINYKAELKESIKNDNKTKKREKGTRKPTKYNRYMAQKMAEFKESGSDLSNNEKFAKIASQWKQDKDSWEDNSKI
jgi:hypothetical protein